MEIEKTIGVERSFVQGSSAHAAVGRRDGLYEGNPPNGSTSILPKKAVKDSSKLKAHGAHSEEDLADSSRVIGLATGVISNVGQSGSMA